jgi:hypothetical protein
MTRAYYPSYLGGRDQEDCDPISKIFITKKGGAVGVAPGESPKFKPQYCKKKVSLSDHPEIHQRIIS